MLKKLYIVAFYICLASVEFLATTTIKIETVESMWDKSNHFIAFLVLYILLSLAYEKLSILNKSFWLLAFAIQIEIVQYFIPGRYFSALDVVADSIGILLGIGLYKLYMKRVRVTSS